MPGDIAAPPEALEAGWLLALAESYQRRAAEVRAAGAIEAADALGRLSRELRAEAGSLDATATALDLPEEDDDDRPPPHRWQAYDVWRAAVRDRERLFAELSARAGMAPAAATRRATEVRARAQLGPLARLRLERRRAWRARPAPVAPPEIRSPGELVAYERAADHRLRTELGRLEARLDPGARGDLRRLLRDLGGGEESPRGARQRLPEAIVVETARRLLEDHFDALLEIARRTTDPDVQARAQALAEVRLAELRRLLETARPG